MSDATVIATAAASGNRLNGRRALVTGSSKGIGRALAVRLAREGADVVVNYHSDPHAAAEALAEIEVLGRRGLILEADLGDVTAVRELIPPSCSR